jgi:hypothetical protein
MTAKPVKLIDVCRTCDRHARVRPGDPTSGQELIEGVRSALDERADGKPGIEAGRPPQCLQEPL